MDPVFVPAPPKSAFNKNRRVSDLLAGQLKHFQHVERKNGIAIPAATARDVHTEGGAARYIAQMTRAIRGAAKPGLAVVAATQPIKARKQAAKQPGLALAASATKTSATAKAKRPAGKKKGRK